MYCPCSNLCCIDCFSDGYSPTAYGMPRDMKVMIGEAGGPASFKDKEWSICELYEAADRNDYSGLMMWSANAMDEWSNATAIEEGLQCYTSFTS